MASPKVAIVNSEKKSNDSLLNQIERRCTQEIVIALCGAIGSKTTIVKDKMEQIFRNYGYDVKTIKISHLIERRLAAIKNQLEKDKFLEKYFPDLNPLENQNTAERIAVLQSGGNILRQKYEPDILAQLAISEIAYNRPENPQPDETRVVHIIDSLKNPAEEKMLRAVYNNMFYLFGVLCPEGIREQTLTKDIEKRTDALQLMERDKSESEKSGQRLLDTIFRSDFFIRTDHPSSDAMEKPLERFIAILLGDKKYTPTAHEHAMFHAYSASLKSGCLSKQVGAAIMDEDGNIISTGCNDVPKFGGGLYTTETEDMDNRCIVKGSYTCENQNEKNKIFDNLSREIDNIFKEKATELKSEIKNLKQMISGHKRLKNLTEYCRAIHAEMDAITSVARTGTRKLKKSSLFSTTFPCHNCAKHIVATGIEKVYYIEPYEKSLAMHLHDDAICLDSQNEETGKVNFIPFEGVSHIKYLNFFYAPNRKNSDGSRKTNAPKDFLPTVSVPLEPLESFEDKVVDNLTQLELIKIKH